MEKSSFYKIVRWTKLINTSLQQIIKCPLSIKQLQHTYLKCQIIYVRDIVNNINLALTFVFHNT